MSMIGFDGFDHYNPAGSIPGKWFAANFVDPISPGRSGLPGSQCVIVSGTPSVWQIPPSLYHGTITAGFAVYGGANPQAWFAVRFMANPTGGSTPSPEEMCEFRVNPSGGIEFWQYDHDTGGALSSGLATTTNPVNMSGMAWSYIELQVTMSGAYTSGAWPATGAIAAQVNGAPVTFGGGNPAAVVTRATSTVSGYQTASANYSVFTQVGFVNGTFAMDDFYILNGTTGSGLSSSFLGDVQVTFLPVLSQGAVAELSGTNPQSSGYSTNYKNMTNAPPVTTQYNYSGTAGNEDTYILSTLNGSNITVYGVQVTLCASKDPTTIGTVGVSPVVRRGSTDYTGSYDYALSTSWAFYASMFELDPSTSGAWTPDNINSVSTATQFGAKVQSS